MYDRSQAEAAKFLDDAQYLHLAEQMQALAREADPSHPTAHDVKRIDTVYELRDGNGILYPHDVRLFFGIDDDRRAIVTLGTREKKGQNLPDSVYRLMKIRWRKYLDGEYGFP
jgi:hypothetical protein